MSEEFENLKTNVPKRIRYVEPNDIYGVTKDTPLTPDYTDFCISFDLIVRRARRTAVNESTDISSEDPKMSEKIIHFESVNTGVDMGKDGDGKSKIFQSVYYTDINREDYKEHEIAEGVGVSSIDISYESFFCPTVKMHLVDVRGSSMFGVEEQAHDSYNQVKRDNLYSAFFTMPYPEFRLQIKGFYGQAVTFQLCCVDFRGAFNSDTGNFEADVTFLGYDYGLLAEIPFRYLVAAPYCEYVGADYWKEHLNNEGWKMSDGHPPITLLELAQNINRCIISGTSEEGEASALDTYISREDLEHKESLESIRTALDEFHDDVVTQCSNKEYDYYDKKDFAFVLFSKKDSGNDFDVSKRDELLEKIKTHNESFPGEIDVSDISNLGSGEANQQWNAVDNQATIDPSSLFKIGEDLRIYDREDMTKYNVFENFMIDNNLLGTNRYYSAYDISSLYNTVDEKIAYFNNEINSKRKDIIDKINNGTILIRDVLNTTPNIGNVFKTVMCHVETFLHMIYTCADIIYSQKTDGDSRTKDKLGVCTSDIPFDNNFIFPFVGLTKPSLTNEMNADEMTNYGNSRVVCYTKDCKNGESFEETKLVNALCKAMIFIQSGGEEEEEIEPGEKYYPIAPFECNRENIPDMAGEKIDSVAGYLATRAATLFGVMNNGEKDISSEVCEIFGRMEGYNYYKKIRDKGKIESIFFKSLGGNKLSDVLYKISICDDSVSHFASNVNNRKSTFAFEMRKNVASSPKRGRQPIFKVQDEELEYVYTVQSNKVAIIPEGLDSYADYYKTSKYPSLDYNNGYFEPKKNTRPGPIYTYDGLVYGSTIQYSWRLIAPFNFYVFAGYRPDKYEDEDEYTNYGYGEEIREKVRKVYRKMRSGVVESFDYSGNIDFSPVLDRHWDLNENDYTYFFCEHSCILSCEEKETSLLYPENVTSDDESLVRTSDDINSFHGDLQRPKIDLGEIKVQDYGIDSDSVWVPKLQATTIDTGGSRKTESLFLSYFYNIQNAKESPTISTMLKCLLFLQSLGYDIGAAKDLLRKDGDTPGKIKSAPYGLLLLIGGLYWYQSDDEYSYVDYDQVYIPSFRSPVNGNNDPQNFRRDYKISPLMLRKVGDGNYELSFIVNTQPNSNLDYVNVEDVAPGDLDFSLKNELINMFESFALTKFQLTENYAEIIKWQDPGRRDSSIEEELRIREISEYLFYFRCGLEYADYKYNNSQSEGETVSAPVKNMINYIKFTDKIDFNLSSFFKNYSMFYVNKEHNIAKIRLLFRKSNEEFQNMVKKTYASEVIIGDTSYMSQTVHPGVESGSYELKIKKSCFEKYLNGFALALNEVTGKKHDEAVYSGVFEVNDKYETIKLSIYLYLKHLWDKWLLHDYFDDDVRGFNEKIISGVEKYNVENYFSYNFVFIDSFYVSIYQKLHVNCNKLLAQYNSSVSSTGGFCAEFLTHVASDNKCLMFGFPGYGFFANYDDEKDGMRKMNSLFTPYPYSKKDPIESMNKFVVMYSSAVSDVSSINKEYAVDAFDIWSGESTDISSITSVSNSFEYPRVLDDCDYNLDGREPYDIQMNRYGYYVPSFGVAYSRSNNSVFKKIGVSMSTPMITQQVAQSLQDISNKGGTNDHKVSFYGQDLYSIYSNYSYMCEIEMMGNAQIMPLMYFQLTNVPMFRGTYMVVSVNHSVQPGKMVTKIKGFKMSKNQLPYNRDWFVKPGNYLDGGNDYSSCSSANGSGSYPAPVGTNAYGSVVNGPTTLDETGYFTVKNVKNSYNITTYDANIVYMLKETINPLMARYEEYCRKKGRKPMKFQISGGLRPMDADYGSKGSQHKVGEAVDIQPYPSLEYTLNTKEKTDYSIKCRNENFLLFSLLVGYGAGAEYQPLPFDQAIIEHTKGKYNIYDDNGQIVKDENGKNKQKEFTSEQPRWIHISSTYRQKRQTSWYCYDPDLPDETSGKYKSVDDKYGAKTKRR